MPKTVRNTRKTPGSPKPDRPNIPYGLQPPKEGLGLLPWSRAADRLRGAYVYWIATADNRGPHAVPVWGVWLDGTLYFSNGEDTRTGRALASNGRVAVHLESGEDALMLEGDVERIDAKALVRKINAAYASKYLWPEGMEWWWAVRPRVAFAYLAPSIGLGSESLYTGSATRWRFPEGRKRKH